MVCVNVFMKPGLIVVAVLGLLFGFFIPSAFVKRKAPVAKESRRLNLGLHEVQATVEMAWTAGKTGKSLEWTTNAVAKIFEYAKSDILWEPFATNNIVMSNVVPGDVTAPDEGWVISSTPKASTNFPMDTFTTNREPEWSLAFSNDNTTGPSEVVKTEGDRITGRYRIDYSTNLAETVSEDATQLTGDATDNVLTFVEKRDYPHFEAITFNQATGDLSIHGQTLTNYVNKISTDGTFCRVRGHTWGEHMHVTAEYSPNALACRQCSLCGLHQERYEEWR